MVHDELLFDLSSSIQANCKSISVHSNVLSSSIEPLDSVTVITLDKSFLIISLCVNMVDVTYIEGCHKDCSPIDLAMLQHQDAIVDTYMLSKQQNSRIGDSTLETNGGPEMEAFHKSLSNKRVQHCF